MRGTGGTRGSCWGAGRPRRDGTWRGLPRVLVRPHLLHQGILSRDHVFRCARVSLSNAIKRPPILGAAVERSSPLSLRLAGHSPSDRGPQLPASRCFAAAHHADETPMLGLGSRCLWLPCTLASFRNSLQSHGAYRTAERSPCTWFE